MSSILRTPYNLVGYPKCSNLKD